MKILTSKSASGLNEKIEAHRKDGYKPIGSHQVVTKAAQLQFAGNQHRRTEYSVEYSQSVVRDEDDYDLKMLLLRLIEDSRDVMRSNTVGLDIVDDIDATIKEHFSE